MARARMILVKITMQVPQGSVIGTMLFAAVETFLVSTLVRFVHLAMESPVFPVITSMPTVVIVVMRERSGSRCRYGQHRRRNENFADGHGTSPGEPGPGKSRTIELSA